MSSSLKISADTTDAKKSILEIGKSIKDMKGSSISIFKPEDRKFLKTEMAREITAMKGKLKDNREQISIMVKEQQKLVAGSKEELELREKILKSYKDQAKAGRDLGRMQKAEKDLGGGVGSGGGGLLGKIAGFAKLLPALAAAATIGYAISKGSAASSQFVAGSSSRTKLKGLGEHSNNFGGASELARVGLSEQDMIQRRIEATSTLGRSGTNNDTELRKASFERAFGLEGGVMTGVASQMRGQKGGEGATDAQMKLQSSILAAGIEDAIGPYLQSAVQLLTGINESGTINTDEITNLLAMLTKDGQRTPELIARTFAGLDSAVKGATGESSAFLQSAFARAGIGGGTIGGTKFAMASGGIMGQSRSELEKRGYSSQLLDSMESSGMFSSTGERTGAILNQMKASGGLGAGDSISGVSNVDQMVGMGNLANNVFGTKGDQGFDALMMLEQVQNLQMTQKEFEDKLKTMKEGNDPSLSRLDKINNSIAGVTEVLTLVNTNLMEALGTETVQMRNAAVTADNQGIKGVTGLAGVVNDSGITSVAQKSANAAGTLMDGGLGSTIQEHSLGNIKDRIKFDTMTSEKGISDFAKKRRDEGKGFIGMSDEEIEGKIKSTLAKNNLAKDIGKEVGRALKESPITNTNINKIKLPDGSVTNRVGK